MNTEKGDRVAVITIRLLEEYGSAVKDQARKAVESKITPLSWDLYQSGLLLGSESDTELEDAVQLVIDTEDKQTVESVNKLPRYFAGRMNLSELPRMRLKVNVSTPDKSRSMFWGENGFGDDVIIFDNEGVYLESLKQQWDALRDIDPDKDSEMEIKGDKG